MFQVFASEKFWIIVNKTMNRWGCILTYLKIELSNEDLQLSNITYLDTTQSL